MRGPLVAVLTLSVALAACGQSKKSGATFLSINTATISQGSFKPSIKAISPLESTTNVTLSPETDGRVIKKLVKEGDQVQAGQVILVLDNTQLSAQLDASKSQARYDKVNAERYQFLYEQGAETAQLRDAYATKAITSRDQAIADKANLNYKFVRSPINGVIGDLDTVKIGDYVKTGDVITGIVDNSTLWTLMEIPASQGSQVKVGQPVQLASQSTPPVTGEGTITFVSPYYAIPKAGNPPNTLMVKAVFPNLTGQLKTGQYVASEIITGSSEQLAVPVQAVMMQAQQPFVYEVVPVSKALPQIKRSPNTTAQALKKLEKLPGNTPIVLQTKVQLGDLQNNLYPVISGLKAGDEVAVSNTSRLRSGMPVKVSAGAN
ncbi:MAG: efflux RND transporter periplasmic adaptor subunit [Synechococcus sp. BS30m-G30]|nr:efflux RND transporter periplasmic adaptor subunit [Synechococcus sp. BS30m-G30]